MSDNNPRLAQLLIDFAISDIISETQPKLTGDRLRGVAEIAKEMGFNVNEKNRCLLGKFVRSRLSHLCKQESRLVNGTMQNIFCYPDTDEVRQVISEFFN